MDLKALFKGMFEQAAADGVQACVLHSKLEKEIPMILFATYRDIQARSEKTVTDWLSRYEPKQGKRAN